MKTLAISLTVVFVTLKLVGVITWPWFWVVSPLPIWLFLIIFIAAIYAAGKTKGEQEENQRIRSKWQERLDKMQGRNTVKTIALVLLACAAMYSCRPAHDATGCLKQPTHKFNK